MENNKTNPSTKGDNEFLEYCALIRDAYAHCSDREENESKGGGGSENSKEAPPVSSELLKRARKFVKEINRNSQEGCQERQEESCFCKNDISVPDFRARLFDCSAMTRWRYDQMRVLHANIVLGMRKLGDGSEQEFSIPYDRMEGKDRPPVPRIPVLLKLEELQLQESYQCVVNAVYNNNSCGSDDNSVCKCWDDDVCNMLRKVLGVEEVNGGKNVFGVNVIELEGNPDRKFNRLIEALGGWWEGTDWKFSNYKSASDLEKNLGIVFFEESEVLWELLRFYTAAFLELKLEQKDGGIEHLMRLFWIVEKDKDNDQLKLTPRGDNLCKWIRREGKVSDELGVYICDWIRGNCHREDDENGEDDGSHGKDDRCPCREVNNAADEGETQKSGGSDDWKGDFMKNTRLIIPVNALLMALRPPPEKKDFYRCEIGFKALDDPDKDAVVKSAWCFLSVNLPEMRPTNNNNDSEVLERIVRKQKLFVNLMLDPVTRDHFKEGYRETIIRHSQRAAIAAIMSRNFSHNIGSHVLANADFFEKLGVLNEVKSPPSDGSTENLEAGKIWRARSRLSEFNNYMQGRLDFIARAMGEIASHPEPMLFVGNMIFGFLRQSLLLNTLVSDNGYTTDNMKFHISVEGEWFTLEPKHGNSQLDRHNVFEPDKPISDVLIAVPGGQVGLHAFYAFMEGYIRNAVKYGAKSKAVTPGGEETLEITLKLKSCGKGSGLLDHEENPVEGYVLSVTDNLSVGDKDVANEYMRKHIDAELIDGDSHEMRHEGHGIQEMKVCAEFLSGGEKGLRFPSDNNLLSGEEASHPLGDYGCYLNKDKRGSRKIAFPAIFRVGRAKLRFCPASEINDLSSLISPHILVRSGRLEFFEAPKSRKKVEKPHALACFMDEKNNHNEQALVYGLVIQKPSLLGIVRWCNPAQGGGEAQTAKDENSVRFYPNIAELAKGPAAFGLVLVDGDEGDEGDESRWNELGGKLLQYHRALPYRLMLVVWEESQREAVKGRISGWEKEGLPVRRVHVIVNKELFNANEGTSEDDWKKLILQVYDQWLGAWKQPPDRIGAWHLGIGFDREYETVEQKWFLDNNGNKKLGSDFDKYTPENLRLHLFTNEHENRHITESGEVDRNNLIDVVNGKKCACLVLDNHGQAVPGGENLECAAYLKFSGAEQVGLFQMLESPPSDPFVRSLMVFSVAEAMLARVVVIDERVAESMIERTRTRGKYITNIQNSEKNKRFKASGIYPVLKMNFEGGQKSISSVIAEALKAEALNADKNIAQEDVDIDWSNDSFSDQLGKPDMIVIHEGVVDHFHEQGVWKKGMHESLFKHCPVVVRTSGRGSKARHLDDRLPFLEFTELSGNTYRQLDKVALVKGIMALRGHLS